MVAGQVTMERPEEMVVTFAPYRCNSACRINLRILSFLLIMRVQSRCQLRYKDYDV